MNEHFRARSESAARLDRSRAELEEKFDLFVLGLADYAKTEAEKLAPPLRMIFRAVHDGFTVELAYPTPRKKLFIYKGGPFHLKFTIETARPEKPRNPDTGIITCSLDAERTLRVVGEFNGQERELFNADEALDFTVGRLMPSTQL